MYSQIGQDSSKPELGRVSAAAEPVLVLVCLAYKISTHFYCIVLFYINGVVWIRLRKSLLTILLWMEGAPDGRFYLAGSGDTIFRYPFDGLLLWLELRIRAIN